MLVEVCGEDTEASVRLTAQSGRDGYYLTLKYLVLITGGSLDIEIKALLRTRSKELKMWGLLKSWRTGVAFSRLTVHTAARRLLRSLTPITLAQIQERSSDRA